MPQRHQAARSTDLITAVEHALRAPSVHNTQPWRWRIRDNVVDLFADGDRHLVATDPERRDLVLSCGAALHHLVVALAATGYDVDVARLPDSEDRDHLATVAVMPGTSDPAEAALFPAIALRHTDRRQLSHRAVGADHIAVLADQALRHGARLVHVHGTDMPDRFAAALEAAAHEQAADPGYAAELQVWTHRSAGSRDGVGPESVAVPPVGHDRPSLLRRFPHRRLRQPPYYDALPDASAFVVVTTAGDTVVDRLRAGESSSAVLLAATRMGLATTPLSQAVEVEHARELLRRHALHVPETPQLVIRLGWAVASAAELPPTPRRSLRFVLRCG